MQGEVLVGEWQLRGRVRGSSAGRGVGGEWQLRGRVGGSSAGRGVGGGVAVKRQSRR